MKKTMLVGFAAIAATCAADVVTPKIGSTATIVQDGGKRVRVTYSLECDSAVVTVDFQTNSVGDAWASIGPQNFTGVHGDVNKVVTGRGSHEIVWSPYRDWPGHDLPANSVRAVVTAWAVETPPDYIVCDLTGSKMHYYYTCAEAVPMGVTNNLYKTEMMVFRRVPAAGVKWRMGSPKDESGRSTNEIPHQVTFSKDYYLGIYPVTQRQHILMTNDTRCKEDLRATNFTDSAICPVDAMRWNQLRGNLDKAAVKDQAHAVDTTVSWTTLPLTIKTFGFANAKIDIPTEAQWEYACRAGCGEANYALKPGEANSAAAVDRIAWYGANSSGRIHPVGLKEPNAWGFYDMLGNVWENVLDFNNEAAGWPKYSGSDVVCDPIEYDTATSGSTAQHVYRGGAVTSASISSIRAAQRSSCGIQYQMTGGSPTVYVSGYRLCLELE